MAEEYIDELKEKIFNIKSSNNFRELALFVFNFQYKNNPVYKEYCNMLNCNPIHVKSIYDIPFMPVEFYKENRICSVKKTELKTFLSSGTTSDNRSVSLIFDVKLYEKSIINSFKLFYGSPENYCFINLIPSAKDKTDSSLAYMAELLAKESKCIYSGSYLNNTSEFLESIKYIKERKIFIFGLSWALVDLVEQFRIPLPEAIIMETGGMKGKRKELTKYELHEILKNAFNTESIHSEYSMCELLSQSYSKANGIFYSPPWKKILIRDISDPLNCNEKIQTGGINIIDLANIYTCSFISTQDIGRIYENGSFEVLGRFLDSDIRGCNLLVE